MNLGMKIGIGVATVAGVGIAAALLGSCAEKNENKTSDGVAGDYVRTHDRNGDGKLNVSLEQTYDVPGSRCTWTQSSDRDGDGFAETTSCLATDSFVTRYSIAALLNHADEIGDKNGEASQPEIAKVVSEFDTGYVKDGQVIGKGDNILQRDEIKEFNRSYDDKLVGEFDH